MIDLKPYKTEYISVHSGGLSSGGVHYSQLSFGDRFGLVHAIYCFCRVHGVEIIVLSDVPPRSALGASGALTVALILGLLEARYVLRSGRLKREEVILAAHHIEDSLFQNTGLQDQCAAAFAGANIWSWDYLTVPSFQRHPIMLEETFFDRNALIAYTGMPHPSTESGSTFLRSVIVKGRIPEVSRIAGYAENFGTALHDRDYRRAASVLTMENSLRDRIREADNPPAVEELVESAHWHHCGARVLGHGGGGCIWAVGEAPQIATLRTAWRELLKPMKESAIIECTNAADGAAVNFQQNG